jgi:hypothetical protein
MEVEARHVRPCQDQRADKYGDGRAAVGEGGIKLGRRGESKNSVLRAFSLEGNSIVGDDGQRYVIKPADTLAVAQVHG